MKYPMPENTDKNEELDSFVKTFRHMFVLILSAFLIGYVSGLNWVLYIPAIWLTCYFGYLLYSMKKVILYGDKRYGIVKSLESCAYSTGMKRLYNLKMEIDGNIIKTAIYNLEGQIAHFRLPNEGDEIPIFYNAKVGKAYCNSEWLQIKE